MWTFGGWDESPFVAGEVRDPERNLPLSILGGLALVALLFIGVNACYLAILSPAELAASGERTATLAMERALGPAGGRALGLALVFSALGVTNGLILTGARLAYAASAEHRRLRWIARIHPRTHTPVNALSLQCLLSLTAILVLPDPYALLIYTSLAYWLFAALMAAAVLVLRRKEPRRQRPFRVWGYPLTPLMFIAASTAMAASVVAESPAIARATVAILAAGALTWRLLGGRRNLSPPG